MRKMRGPLLSYFIELTEKCIKPNNNDIERNPDYRTEVARWGANGDLDDFLEGVYRLNNMMRELMQTAEKIEEYKDYGAKKRRLQQLHNQMKDKK